MSTERLDQLARTLKALPDRLTATVPRVVEDNAFLLELENQQQLEAGLDSRDRAIRPDYAPLTVLLKQEAGEPYDRVTLRDTGDFYASIVAEVRGPGVMMDATDPKTGELVEKYGADVLGLSKEAVDSFRQDVVLPELQDETRRALGL